MADETKAQLVKSRLLLLQERTSLLKRIELLEAVINSAKTKYTDRQVRSLLCGGCALYVPDVLDCDRKEWYHVINGQEVRCLASVWRNKMAEPAYVEAPQSKPPA